MAKAKDTTSIEVTQSFLNVGGNNKTIAVPNIYDGWKHDLLDIDPAGKPDVLCDARLLKETLDANIYDAVYCSHNLEHYYRHDGLKVLQGFAHVIKQDGFAHIRVPDIQYIMEYVVENKLDISSVLYVAEGNQPITVRDTMYGFEKQIEASGKDFFAHKTGFSAPSLKQFLGQAGFDFVATAQYKPGFEIIAYAFLQMPTNELLQKLNIAKA